MYDCCMYNNIYSPIAIMMQLTPETLCQWQEEGRNFMIIDVREPFEHESFNIGGELIPIGSITGAVGHLPKDQPVVIYCEKGIRSVIAIQRLQTYGYDNLYNLNGGMKAWREWLQKRKD
jgi:rhodanese-related sulfurtransferase